MTALLKVSPRMKKAISGTPTQLEEGRAVTADPAQLPSGYQHDAGRSWGLHFAASGQSGIGAHPRPEFRDPLDRIGPNSEGS